MTLAIQRDVDQTMEAIRQRREWAGCLLHVTPADRREIERVWAKVLAETGRHEDALAAYRTLARKFPNEGSIQEEYLRGTGHSWN